MATTRTPLELATNVLLHWNIISAEDTPAPSDSNYIIRRYHDLYESMSLDDETYWGVSAIPAAIFEPLTQMMALIVMAPFGKMPSGLTPSQYAQSLDEGLRVLRRLLRRTTHVRSANETVYVDDF